MTWTGQPSVGSRRVLALARAGLLQCFAVNLYESVVRMPGRVADEHNSGDRSSRRGLLAPGSPARYHLPAAPLVVGTSVAAAVTGLRNDGDRPALLVGAAATLAATASTGYLVRTVNLRLLAEGPPITEEERRRLLARWHGVNRLRLALLAVAFAAMQRAAARH